jgi:hypothetical protein
MANSFGDTVLRESRRAAWHGSWVALLVTSCSLGVDLSSLSGSDASNGADASPSSANQDIGSPPVAKTDAAQPQSSNDGASRTDAGIIADTGATDAPIVVPVDAGNPQDSAGGTGEAGAANKRVFVSSAAFTGNLAGVAGADRKCTDLAQAAGLSGSWVAWLSAPGAHAKNRVTGPGPWVLVGRSAIAVTRAQLTTAAISQPIDRDEKRNKVDAEEAWTGTTPIGTHSDDDCAGFRSQDPANVGAVGSTIWSDSDWTYLRPAACDEPKRIYCFEQ